MSYYRRICYSLLAVGGLNFNNKEKRENQYHNEMQDKQQTRNTFLSHKKNTFLLFLQ